jgi:hypothetical protein
MNDKIVGWIILATIVLLTVLIIVKFGRRVVYPSAAIIRVWGAPKKVKNRPGFLLIPRVGKLLDVVLMPGDWQIIELALEGVLTRDSVRARIKIEIQWRMERIADPKNEYQYGLMNPDAAVTFQASWQPHNFERAVSQNVRETTELTIRKYRSTQLGSDKVMADLMRHIDDELSPFGKEWGVKFDSKVTELVADAASDAQEHLMTEKVGILTRQARGQGLQQAIRLARKEYGYSPDGDAIVDALTKEYTLQSVPKTVGITTVGGDLLDALSGLVGSRVSEAGRRARSRSRRR